MSFDDSNAEIPVDCLIVSLERYKDSETGVWMEKTAYADGLTVVRVSRFQHWLTPLWVITSKLTKREVFNRGIRGIRGKENR